MRIRVNRQRGGILIAHGQAGGIVAGDIAILLAIMDLILLVIIAMNEVARAAAGQPAALEHAIRGKDIRYWTGRVRGRDEMVKS